MKTIIAGSRSIQLYSLIPQAVKDSGFVITELLCGCADGVDRLGFTWARKNHVPVHFFPAWSAQGVWAINNMEPNEIIETNLDHYGKRAGFIRNLEMAKNASALILIWDGQSRGSASMKSIAQSQGLNIYERIV